MQDTRGLHELKLAHDVTLGVAVVFDTRRDGVLFLDKLGVSFVNELYTMCGTLFQFFLNIHSSPEENP